MKLVRVYASVKAETDEAGVFEALVTLPDRYPHLAGFRIDTESPEIVWQYPPYETAVVDEYHGTVALTLKGLASSAPEEEIDFEVELLCSNKPIPLLQHPGQPGGQGGGGTGGLGS